MFTFPVTEVRQNIFLFTLVVHFMLSAVCAFDVTFYGVLWASPHANELSGEGVLPSTPDRHTHVYTYKGLMLPVCLTACYEHGRSSLDPYEHVATLIFILYTKCQ